MTLKKYYQDAIQNGYALGAFNFCNLESLKGILNGATNLNSPVIVSVSSSAMNHMGKEYLKAMIVATKKTYNIPFFFHLDHGKDFDICKTAIDIGFDSVMIDGSGLPFEENVKLTKKVADYAHKYNIQVEGELGRLLGVEDEHVSNESIFTSPVEAKLFVEKTGVDSLAIAIGTSHGINKFEGEPKLAFDILQKIQNNLPNFPLVLHGASSVDDKTIDKINILGGEIKKAKGVPGEMLKKACSNYNVCKINVDTDIRMATTLALREYFQNHRDSVDTKKYFAFAQEKITELVEYKIEKVFNSKDRKKD